MGTCVRADGSSRVGVGAGVVQPLPLTRSRSVASMGDARGRRRATAMLSATFVAISYNEASAQERATCSQVVQNQPRGQGTPVLLASFVVFGYQYISCAGLLPALVPELPDHGMAAPSGSTHLPTSSLSSHIGNGSRRFDQLNWPAPGSEDTKLY
jgi:hypothetical protein